jgi:Asp-tRNA(Asn)/Glu-tRNA(Gln) amidotransferase A subunit family amidase
MRDVDLMLTPSGPTAATPLEGDLVTSEEADPALLASLMNFSGPFDLTGFPAVSIPCGFTRTGLPVGMQLVGKPFAESSLLAAAHAYEQSTAWHCRVPTAIATAISSS